jgi:hypothetical protein
VILALWRPRQEELEFEASLGYIIRPSLKTKQKQKDWWSKHEILSSNPSVTKNKKGGRGVERAPYGRFFCAVIKWDVFFFWWDGGLNLGLLACKAGVLLLEPHLESVLVILEMGSFKLFAWTGLESQSS